MKNSDLKAETEAVICAAHVLALTTNYIKFNKDKTVESRLCRMCGEKGENVGHLISGCKKLAQTEYKRRHDNVAKKSIGHYVGKMAWSEQLIGMIMPRKEW